MRKWRASSGPFIDRIFIEEGEIESIATNELRGVGLLPTMPGPIRVERFIEKRFGIVPRYDELPPGVVGFTRFGAHGAEELVVSRSLAEDPSLAAQRRINSTLAHEAGHILLHTRLFTERLQLQSKDMFQDDVDVCRRAVLCRSMAFGEIYTESRGSHYDGRWWEYQANLVIGALLLPRLLVSAALEEILAFRGNLGVAQLSHNKRDEAARVLSNVFDVNLPVARIRVEALFPAASDRQLTL